MVEYAMARFKTLQDVHGLTRNAMRGLSNGANARGENFECQLTGGIRPGFADLRMIWLIFPINNLWNQEKNWEIARNLLESIGIYGADVLQ